MGWFTQRCARLHNWLARSGRRSPAVLAAASHPARHPPRFEGIGLREDEDPASRRRALVVYASAGYALWRAGRAPSWFNPFGATLEIVRALNELNFIVDLVDAEDDQFVPARSYHLYFGHGRNYGRIAELLPSGVTRVRYATGSHVTSFLTQTHERYRRFCSSRGLGDDAIVFRRDVPSTADYSRVDLLIALGERTAATYSREGIKAVHVHNAAYVEASDAEVWKGKDWERARRRFLYVSGTNGNIQKGLDILIEGFQGLPSQHLYIFSRMEPEILDAYGRELRAPNIHYVYPFDKVSWLKARLFQRCAFSICLGINTGQSTAFIASLQAGLIPVCNAEADLAPGHGEILIRGNRVEDVREAVARASAMSPGSLEDRARQTAERFHAQHRPESFREEIKARLSSCV